MYDCVHIFVSNKAIDPQAMDELQMLCGLKMTNVEIIQHDDPSLIPCTECFKALKGYGEVTDPDFPWGQIFTLMGDDPNEK